MLVITLHKIITLENALALERSIFIDMRSPSEYLTGHVPNAINIPLFTDGERAEVGTIYKQIGVAEAKQQGLKLVSSKLPEIVERIRSLYKDGLSVVIYCWRGGMRSKSVVTVLELMGITAYQLQGGYKGYRHYVLDTLQQFHLQPEIIVLCGSTGVGKTTLLKMLQSENVPVIDLENLANHRGSAFGQVGLGRPQTAQNFDALILNELDNFNSKPFILVECESKRIGNVYLPEVLYQAMQRGRKILVQADIPIRVNRLIAEYTDDYEMNKEALKSSLISLERRLGSKKTRHLLDDFAIGQISEVVETLLTDYYDPLYGYEKANPLEYDLVVNANSLEHASRQILRYLNHGGNLDGNSRCNIARNS